MNAPAVPLHVARRRRLGTPQILGFAGILSVAVALLAAAGASPHSSTPAPGQPAAPSDPAKVAQYRHDVLPVLQENCLRCHGGMNHRSGYNMGTRAAAIAGGNHGVAIVPGNPDSSLLVKLIGPGPYPDDIKPMPLKGKLTPADIATLRKWIADGAVMVQ